MKKCLRMLIILFVLILTTSCFSDNQTKNISKVLGVSLSKGTIVSSIDSHGGFHGDGSTYIETTFTDIESKTIIETIENSSSWYKLPLTDNLKTLVYGKKNDHEETGPYVTNNEGDTLFPVVEKGYYFFLDRHSDRKDKRDDTNILNRYSYNFTIAIYNIDNQTLYYYELDT